MKILAIGTATELCSAALWIDGAVIERAELAPTGHAERILSMVKELLAEGGVPISDLDGLAFDRGPGSFTGVRLGAGAIQGLASALGHPVIGITSLMALAEESGEPTVLPAIDARMGEVYWAVLAQRTGEDYGWHWELEASVSAPDQLSVARVDAVGIGSGWDRYHEVIGARRRESNPSDGSPAWVRNRFPRATHIASLAARRLRQDGALLPWEQEPLYVRNKVTD